MKIIILVLSVCFLSGCFSTNAIKHANNKKLLPKIIHDNAFSEVKWVKLHENGDFDVCFIGNQYRENSEHMLSISKSTYEIYGFGISRDNEKDFYKNRNNEEVLSQGNRKTLGLFSSQSDDLILARENDLQLGCNTGKESSGIYLAQNSILKKDEFYRVKTNPQAVDVAFSNFSGAYFDELHVKFWDGRPYNTISIELKYTDKRYNNFIQESQYIFIPPKFSHNEYVHQSGKYEEIGFFLDLLTSPIQVPYYLLCSNFGCNGPANEPNLNIHI